MRAVRVRQGQTATVDWTVQHGDGVTVDLSQYGLATGEADPRVRVQMREALSFTPSNPGGRAQ